MRRRRRYRAHLRSHRNHDRQEGAVTAGPPIASERDFGKVATATELAFARTKSCRSEGTTELSEKRTETSRSRPTGDRVSTRFAQRQLDTEEIALLLKRGKDLIVHGDIAAARVTLKRAAEANDAEAALALASTYDPFVLRDLKVYGFPADPAKALAWYEKAKELGSVVAPRRLEMLAREAR